jgi:hypothetical protein
VAVEQLAAITIIVQMDLFIIMMQIAASGMGMEGILIAMGRTETHKKESLTQDDGM